MSALSQEILTWAMGLDSAPLPGSIAKLVDKTLRAGKSLSEIRTAFRIAADELNQQGRHGTARMLRSVTFQSLRN
jgi:hypothetical protein